MLVLTRKIGEKIVIDDKITVVVNRISGNRVVLGIEAPKDVRIVRGELLKIVEAFDVPKEEKPDSVPMPVDILSFRGDSLTGCVPRNAR